MSRYMSWFRWTLPADQASLESLAERIAKRTSEPVTLHDVRASGNAATLQAELRWRGKRVTVDLGAAGGQFEADRFAVDLWQHTGAAVIELGGTLRKRP